MNTNKVQSSTSIQFKDLNEFLAKHSTSKTEKKDGIPISPTHTRIPDQKLNVYGGSYIIPREDLPTFYSLYYSQVFVNKKMEYLTEKQHECGPIAIDVDLRYNHSVEKRQHTKEHIVDLITLLYLEEIKEFFVFESGKPFSIYVFEKPDVNRLADGSLTKDGVHIIIGIQMNHILQTMLREKIVEKIKDIWDLPIINTWDAVFDEGISKGTTNWQLFGSRKPGNQAYELTQLYNVSYDSRDSEFMVQEEKITERFVESNFDKMTVQYADHPLFAMTTKTKEIYDTRSQNGLRKAYNARKNVCKNKVRLLCVDGQNDDGDDDGCEQNIQLEDINCASKLKSAVENIINNLPVHEYSIKEAHEYTQILPSKYYEPGSHALNRQVGFALKHTDERLFLSWVMLRSKASDFEYDTIPQLYTQWTKYFKERPNGVTIRSIMYWAKQDSFDEYEAVKKNTRDYYIDQSINSPTEFDFALVLHQMFKDQYVCSSLVSKTWYVFKRNRWELDRGQSLRMAISVEMYNIYQNKISILNCEMGHYKDNDEERYKGFQKACSDILTLSTRLKKTVDKNNIMREAEVLFFDADFDKKVDSNKWLLCFNNGVVDLKERVFRAGRPQDYITKSTNINYEPFDNTNTKHVDTSREIEDFMNKLFPDKSLNTYMWNHLASTLIGENKNQCFNIYRGSGSNGKSMLTDMMEKSLGDYYGTVPITLVTEKRPGIGGTTSEIIQLKGVRYAVMQEPSKDAKINEGMMKQLTGDSKLSGRALYHEQETFAIQFHLVVCTNTLFEINSNDDGTWRRIRICDFMSKFVDPGSQPLPNVPHQFPKDKNLKDKLDDWAVMFASMLVKQAFDNQGVVDACDMVVASSNKYRQGQDHISAFVNEMVGKNPDKFIKKTELCEQFKFWFQEQEGGNRRAPKPTEVYEYMDNKFGKACRGKLGMGWEGVEILYSAAEEDEMCAM